MGDPEGCPGLLLFLPPLQALPVFSSSKEGLPLVPSFPLGLGRHPPFMGSQCPAVRAQATLSLKTTRREFHLLLTPRGKASSLSSVQMARPHRTYLENCAYTPAPETQRDLSRESKGRMWEHGVRVAF